MEGMHYCNQVGISMYFHTHIVDINLALREMIINVEIFQLQ